jgi:hypothetical protein
MSKRTLLGRVAELDPIAGGQADAALDEQVWEEIFHRVIQHSDSRHVVGHARPVVPRRGHLARRRRLMLLAGVAAISTFVALLLPVLRSDPLRGALAIERRGKVIHVRVKDAALDPQAMANDLRASGIHAEVVTVPAVPNEVGRWIEAEYDIREVPGLFSHSKGGIEPISNQVARNVEVLRIPANFSTWIRLEVGRPAKPGEDFVEGGGQNELLEHGALDCLGLDQMTPEQAAVVLARYDYELIWVYGGESHTEPPETGKIYWAWFQRPDLLRVVVDLSGKSALQRDHEPPTGIRGPCA